MSIVAIDERIENLSGVSWHSTEVHNRENGERFVKSEFVMDDGGFYTLSLLYESIADKYPIGRHIMALCNVDGFFKVDKCVNITKSLLGKDFKLIDVTSAPDNTVIMNFIGVEKITHDFITPENNGKLIIEKISCFIDELNEKENIGPKELRIQAFFIRGSSHIDRRHFRWLRRGFDRRKAAPPLVRMGRPAERKARGKLK